MLTLDVGCGITPRGIINCDRFSRWKGLSEEGVKCVRNRNFVKCDGQHLPFKSNVFEKVFCFHVIEHVTNPFQLLKELLRVCRGRIFVRCPHRFSRNAKNPYHLHYFTRTWFAQQLEDYPFDIKTRLEPTPFSWGPLFLDGEIQVTVDNR